VVAPDDEHPGQKSTRKSAIPLEKSRRSITSGRIAPRSTARAKPTASK
jgi:hypothetical protein